VSLGLFAAVVVKLEADRKVSVAQLATWLGVPEQRVVEVLLDVRAQGHCTLWGDAADVIVGAQWVAPVEPYPCA
jgi:hypothetical protein